MITRLAIVVTAGVVFGAIGYAVGKASAQKGADDVIDEWATNFLAKSHERQERYKNEERYERLAK